MALLALALAQPLASGRADPHPEGKDRRPGRAQPAARESATAAGDRVADADVGPGARDASRTAGRSVARADSSGSLLAHNPDRSAGYPGSVGENIAGWRGRLTLASLLNAVNQWGGEARDYNIVRNTCAGEPNSIHHQWRKCAHYTQIVSATTTKVGCARSVCPNLKFPITIVCNFGNAGNVYDAATGTVNRPYELTAAGGRPVTPRAVRAAGRPDSPVSSRRSSGLTSRPGSSASREAAAASP